MRFSIATKALAATAAMFVASTSAHIGPGIPHTVEARDGPHQHRRGVGMTPVLKRAPSAPSDEPSAATNTVSSQECQPYNLPEVAAIKAKFPTVWQTAQIVPGDTEAQQLWQNIQSSGIIPQDVKQKGSGGKGVFTGVTAGPNDCWWTKDKCVTPKHPNIPEDIWDCPSPDTWGLTFDDGPNCTHNAFYDFLKQNNQKASLFYIGSNVFDWPLEAQRGFVEGHQICVHTWSHQYMTQLTDEQIFAELFYTGKAIKDVVGVTANCWRPPYGDVDDRVRAIATGLGMSTNIWSADTEDWQVKPLGTKPKSVVIANYNSIINQKYDTHGTLVLTHEINAYTMQMMMQMYPTIKQHFKNIVPITACQNISKPYAEDISYPDFAAYVGGQIEPSGLPDPTAIKVTDATYSPIPVASQSAPAISNGNSNSKQQSAKKSSASRTLALLNNKIALASGLVAVAGFILIA